jgi:hypothetical protein
MSDNKAVPLLGLVNILTGAFVGFLGADGFEYLITATCLQGGVNYVIPLTGNTVTAGNTVKNTVLEPAGTLANLTFKMPPNPVDQQVVAFSTTQILTILTVSANTGQTMANGMPTAATAGQGFAFIFNKSLSKWFRIY